MKKETAAQRNERLANLFVEQGLDMTPKALVFFMKEHKVSGGVAYNAIRGLIETKKGEYLAMSKKMDAKINGPKKDENDPRYWTQHDIDEYLSKRDTHIPTEIDWKMYRYMKAKVSIEFANLDIKAVKQDGQWFIYSGV